MKQNYTIITRSPEFGFYSATYVVAENKEEAITRALSDIYGSAFDEQPTKEQLENFDEEVVGVIEGNVKVDFCD